MSKPRGYRGYIASRPILGERAPQHVQNLVVRDYAARKGLKFLLSATEWAMPSCYMILQQVIDAIEEVDGVICYSMFMLPANASRRQDMIRRILDHGRDIHFAVEGLKVSSEDEARRVEDIWLAKLATSSPALQSDAHAFLSSSPEGPRG